MLSRGFKEQIYDIYRNLPPACQVILVSATMPQEVLDMTKNFMHDPLKVMQILCLNAHSFYPHPTTEVL